MFQIKSMKYIYIIFLWYSIHYVTPYLYIYFCVPKTFSELIVSPIKFFDPKCNVLRWLQNHSTDSIFFIQSIFTTWVITYVSEKLTINGNNNHLLT